MAIIYGATNITTTYFYNVAPNPQIPDTEYAITSKTVAGQHGARLVARRLKPRDIVLNIVSTRPSSQQNLIWTDFKGLLNFLFENTMATAPVDFAVTAITESTLQIDHISTDIYDKVTPKSLKPKQWATIYPREATLVFHQSRPFLQ